MKTDYENASENGKCKCCGKELNGLYDDDYCSRECKLAEY
jgi:hypothetical protein